MSSTPGVWTRRRPDHRLDALDMVGRPAERCDPQRSRVHAVLPHRQPGDDPVVLLRGAGHAHGHRRLRDGAVRLRTEGGWFARRCHDPRRGLLCLSVHDHHIDDRHAEGQHDRFAHEREDGDGVHPVLGRSAPPSGFGFDVQVKRPGSSTWVSLRNDTLTPSTTWTPTNGTGTYRFRTRLQRLGATAASGWSAASRCP